MNSSMTCFKGQVEVCFPTQSHFGSVQYGFSYLKLRYFLASCSIPLSQCQSPSLYTYECLEAWVGCRGEVELAGGEYVAVWSWIGEL